MTGFSKADADLPTWRSDQTPPEDFLTRADEAELERKLRVWVHATAKNQSVSIQLAAKIVSAEIGVRIIDLTPHLSVPVRIKCGRNVRPGGQGEKPCSKDFNHDGGCE